MAHIPVVAVWKWEPLYDDSNIHGLQQYALSLEHFNLHGLLGGISLSLGREYPNCSNSDQLALSEVDSSLSQWTLKRT